MKLGAIYQEGSTSFRVWAPKGTRVDLVLERAVHPMTAESRGYFVLSLPLAAGARYKFRLDGGEAFPDPCSRSQPGGPHDSSEVVDPAAFRWSDAGWKGIHIAGQVLYELHVGTFTPEGTWAAAATRLAHLKNLGITCVEVMPVNCFDGSFNWGYDGVAIFAPFAGYGTPDDMRRFVDAAHATGLAVILDVVYNHFGPSGNYLGKYSDDYVTDKYPAEWGAPVRFEGEEGQPVREFVTENAAHWVAEYHLDGLRIDATQNLHDESSPRHIVADIVSAARTAAGSREIILVCESESQNASLVERCGADAIWVDDFHHCARVAATGSAEAYMQDYGGTAQELLACATRNAIYQGQFYAWQMNARGTQLWHLPSKHMVFALQNHDQVANSLLSQRLHEASAKRITRALTTWLLLSPQTPMLFQGQEFFSDSPFMFFADHDEALMKLVHDGRRIFLEQFPSAKYAFEAEGFDVPVGREAFDRSKVKWPGDPQAFLLHQQLLQLRTKLKGPIQGATLSSEVVLMRYERHLVLLNVGSARSFDHPSEPLLAPPPGARWQPLLGSEGSHFGGTGAVFPDATRGWRLSGRAACVLEAVPR